MVKSDGTPEGTSILGELLKGNQGPTPAEIDRQQRGAPPGSGVTNLSSTDSDCANNSPLGIITEPLCVAGKSIFKSGNILGDWRIWAVVAVIVILILIAIIKL
jgi:hypothetical protein